MTSMEDERFIDWVKTKENKNFVICAAGIFVLVAAAGYIHGLGTLHYASWSELAQNVPCDKVEKADHGLSVTAPLVVGYLSYEERYTVEDQQLVKTIDDRCRLGH